MKTYSKKYRQCSLLDVKCLNEHLRKLSQDKKLTETLIFVSKCADIFYSLQPTIHINDGIEDEGTEIGMTCDKCLPNCSEEVCKLQKV